MCLLTAEVPLAYNCRKRGIDFCAGAGVEDLEGQPQAASGRSDVDNPVTLPPGICWELIGVEAFLLHLLRSGSVQV
jgi:hypothetical protein